MSNTSTAPKRATAQDYNGPKAVRDHGRVATREKNSAASDETEQSSGDEGTSESAYETYLASLDKDHAFGVSSGGAEITP